MSVDAALQAALRPLGLPVFPNKYTGKMTSYIVTNWTMLGAAHGGDFAGAARYLVQVHYYLPDKQNPNGMLENILQALAAADFTSGDVINAHVETKDANAYGQHYVIEVEYCDGGVNYGHC